MLVVKEYDMIKAEQKIRFMGEIMKWLKRIGAAVLVLPVVLPIIFIMYETFGMCVNHLATKRQTDKLQINLEKEIPDIKIVRVYSETGNTSGTGNHVDCLSSVIFSTGMQKSEIESSMSKYYQFDEWYLDKTKTGQYLFYLNTTAPFEDNLEGH